MNFLKYFFSAFIGAAYTIVAIVYPIATLRLFIAKLVLVAVMIFIAYSPSTKKEVIKYILSFYMVSLIFGGLVLSILSDLGSSVLSIVLGITICTFVLLSLWKIFKIKLNKESFMCNICIEINDNIIYLKSLIDTGHELKDNLTEADVILVNKSSLVDILPNEILELLTSYQSSVSKEYETRIRIINYKAVGTVNGVIMGFKIDKVTIYYDGKTIVNKNCIVATPENKFKDFDAIINLRIIDRGEIYGNTSINKIKDKKIIHKIFN
jgi:stage II sporulation protein GA (sporulation sigma-E factor processing peptidase)